MSASRPPRETDHRSTVETGNEFRDHVCHLLAAAGFHGIAPETRESFKKADAAGHWIRDTIIGRMRFLIETKDYVGALPKQECINFIVEYGALLENKTADHAWLISRNSISPDGRKLIESKAPQLKCFTYPELQRHLFQVDGYLLELVDQYKKSAISQFYVKPTTANGDDLEASVQDWMAEEASPPLAILGGYGTGKSTFALHFSAMLAEQCLRDATRRVPILVPLGQIVDDQTIDGLLGKVLASQHRVDNYHFHLFHALNQAGRLLVIFDGLDEMKHGMTISVFEQNMLRLLELDASRSKILILGRDTAFQSDVEFRAIVQGRQTTAGGQTVSTRGRRALRHVTLRGFNLEEARWFIRHYFPIAAREAASLAKKKVDEDWLGHRLSELLSGFFDELIVKPVHAQMLCEIATEPNTEISGKSTFDLYDLFIHYLIDREVRKPGRYPKFTIPIRRSFNAAVAWWLWQRANASTTTLGDVPVDLCYHAISGTPHEFDEVGLKRELTTGCLVEKNGQTIYFGHRSLQEFLVSEHIFKSGLIETHKSAGSIIEKIWPLFTEVTSEFLFEWSRRAGVAFVERARVWIDDFSKVGRVGSNPAAFQLLTKIFEIADLAVEEYWHSPWSIMLGFSVAQQKGVLARNALIERVANVVDVDRSRRAVATALCIYALSFDDPSGEPSLSPLRRLLLPGPSIAEAMDRTQVSRSRVVRVNPEKDLAFWCMLKSCRVRREGKAPPQMTIDMKNLFLAAAPLTGLPFIEWGMAGSSVQKELRVDVEPRSFSGRRLIKDELAQISKFFNERSFRDRITPDPNFDVSSENSRSINVLRARERVLAPRSPGDG